MPFFSNRTINCLNLHLALVNVLDQSYQIFIPLYLYQQGFSIPSVLALYALLNALRIPLRFLSFPIVHRLGLKAGTMIGAVGYALTYPLLSLVHGWDGWLLLYIGVFSLFNALHWQCFHCYYSLAGDQHARGRHYAVAQALTALFLAIAPVISAIAITETGYSYYFLFALILGGGMLFALAGAHHIPVAPLHWRSGRKLAFNLGAKLQFTEASAVYPLRMAWIFTLYLYTQQLVMVGGLIAIGVAAQMLYQLMLGAWFDRGHGRRILPIGNVMWLLQALGKALLPLSLPIVIGIEAFSAVGNVHADAAKTPVMYNVGKSSAHTFWYWMFAEIAWDLGTIVGAGGSALLLWAGCPLRLIILIALPFIAMSWWLLHRYFRSHVHDCTAT